MASLTIYIAAKRKFDNGEVLNSAPMICMSVFLFNPAIIFDSAVWGKWDDALVSLFLLFTIYYYNTYKVGAFYALSVFSKLQGLIFLPILFKIKNLHKLTISFVITTAVLLIPVREQITVMYYYVNSSFDMFPLITVNAYNFWWLFNWIGWTSDLWNTPRDTQVYFMLTPKFYGIFFYSLIALLLNLYLRKYRYNFRALCFASFFIYLTFFMFFTRVHERYMYYALPFLALLVAVAEDRRYLYFYIVFSITFFLNIYSVYELYYPFLLPNLPRIEAMTIGIAAVNLVVYIYLLYGLIGYICMSEWQKTNYKILGFAIPEITDSK